MKKVKFLLVAAVILSLATLLSACNASGGSASMGKVIDVDYDLSEPIYTKLEKIDALEGYGLASQNEWLAVFSDLDVEEGYLVFKVLNLKTLEVVSTFKCEGCTYTVSLPVNNAPVFVVTKVEEGKDGDLLDTTYALYDINGEKLSSTSKYEPDAPLMFADDLLIYDNVAYNVDTETGKTKKSMDIPEYLMPTGYDEVYSTDKYFILVYNEEKVVTLDREFNRVSSYYVPTFRAYGGKVVPSVLDNGNLFVQYVVELPDDAAEYDIYEINEAFPEGKKFNMVTLLVDVANGKEKELKCNYAVFTVLTGTYLRELDNRQVSDGVENMALVVHIEEKKLSADSADLRFVLLGNNGSITTVDIVDNQGNNMPTKIADNLFMMPTLDGTVLLDKSGKVIKTLNNSVLENYGAYFVGEHAIYDLELNSVYNFSSNKAEFVDAVGGSVFVEEEMESGYKVVMFRDGQQKTVFTYDEDEDNGADFELTDFGYAIADGDNGKTKYYNVQGDLIDSVTGELSVIVKLDDGGYILEGLDSTYYVLSETAK